MTAPEKIVLDVLAPLAAEHPPFQAAARQLAHWIGTASGINHPIALHLRKTLELREIGGPGVIVVSLLNEVASIRIPFAEVAARWHRQAAALTSATPRPVFFCTVFRHVPAPADPPEGWSRASLLERIRRLNLLAAELSQATGAYVIDIDRTLAHFGASPLRTDYALAGKQGAEVAGDVIAAALLGAGLDDLVDAEVLEEARQLHGGLEGLAKRLHRLVTQS